MGEADSHSICVDVVEAIAAAEGTTPHDLDFTLYDHISVDALVKLYQGNRGKWAICFEVPGHKVRMESDGAILVDGHEMRSN